MNLFFSKLIALLGLILTSPLIIFFVFLIFLEDKSESPIFKQKRVGKKGNLFYIFKLRSMRKVRGINFNSTSLKDPRILKSGNIARKFKIDELPQLINILQGKMSFVGPRPNILDDVKKYNNLEKKLLTVNPGITDPSSIIFSDESEILSNESDPDEAYDKLIRPWKNLFALIYINEKNIYKDILIVFLTLFSKFNRNFVLFILSKVLHAKRNSLAYKVINRSIDLKEAIIPPPEEIRLK